MIIKFNKYKLFENPNTVLSKDSKETIEWSKTDVSFSYFSGKLYISHGTHASMIFDVGDKLKREEYFRYVQMAGRGEYSGRLFIKQQIITFWKFPENKEKLKEIVKDLENELNITIWDDEWRIEILQPDVEEFLNWGDLTWSSLFREVEYIPIKDYKNSKERDKEELKQGHLKIGYGDKDSKYGSRLKAKRNPISWEQAKRTSEAADIVYSDGDVIRYNDFLAFPFTYSNGNIIFDKEGQTHIRLNDKYDGQDGRIWVDKKIISFWELETNNLEHILKLIQNEYNDKVEEINRFSDITKINFFDGEWKIDLHKTGTWRKNTFNKNVDFNLDKLTHTEYKIPISEYFRRGDSGYLVSLLDFLKTTNGEVVINKDEKAYQQHLLSWKERENLKKQGKLVEPRGFGSDKQSNKVKGVKSLSGDREMTPAQWNHHKKQESVIQSFESYKILDSTKRNDTKSYYFKSESIISKFNKYKLFENPDTIIVADKFGIRNVEWDEDVWNISFSYYNGDMYVGGYTHESLIEEVEDEIKERDGLSDDEFIELMNKYDQGRGECAGRLFVDYEIITFWDFPEDNEELLQVIKDLEEHVGFKIGDEWLVELSDMDEYVRIKDYKKSYKRSEEELKQGHLKIGSGDKDSKYGSRLKAKRNPIEWEQAKRTSENIKFKNYVKL